MPRQLDRESVPSPTRLSPLRFPRATSTAAELSVCRWAHYAPPWRSVTTHSSLNRVFPSRHPAVDRSFRKPRSPNESSRILSLVREVMRAEDCGPPLIDFPDTALAPRPMKANVRRTREAPWPATCAIDPAAKQAHMQLRLVIVLFVRLSSCSRGFLSMPRMRFRPHTLYRSATGMLNSTRRASFARISPSNATGGFTLNSVMWSGKEPLRR